MSEQDAQTTESCHNDSRASCVIWSKQPGEEVINVQTSLQYVAWANETDPDSFFTSDRVKGLYKDHIKAMTSHVNSLSSVAYKDDPTIMAWGENILYTMSCTLLDACSAEPMQNRPT